ncbi:helix-turn-helix domain-containing protein [Halomonas cupida]|uniref:helix-turn-helix domain-containing protein n=1 Tax=Halomonas cupida TaxID=44933 RepID=UPI0035310FBF
MQHLTTQVSLVQGASMRQIDRLMERSPSTISREIRRNQERGRRYAAHSGHGQRPTRLSQALRTKSQ